MVNDIIMQKYVLLKPALSMELKSQSLLPFLLALFWNHCLAAKHLEKLQLYIACIIKKSSKCPSKGSATWQTTPAYCKLEPFMQYVAHVYFQFLSVITQLEA